MTDRSSRLRNIDRSAPTYTQVPETPVTHTSPVSSGETAEFSTVAPSSVTPLVGKALRQFAIDACLGMGGMGVVYSAMDRTLDRRVALKVMRDEHVADDQRRARFLREARTAGSLVHPNIAAIYEVGEADGAVFIAMELVQGESLRAMLRRDRVDVSRALRWAIGIARALVRAHGAGIIHRDLKPDNVMITLEDEAKLLDFGIAKALRQESPETAPPTPPSQDGTLTADGAILGTPQYVSPEQARGAPVDARSDVFSFGTVLFEVLSGASPFRRETVVATLAAVIHDPVRSLRDVRADVPRAVDAIVLRCLAKDPSGRYGTAAELLAALNDAASGGERDSRIVPTRAAVLGAVVALAALGGAGAAIGVRGSRHDAASTASTPSVAASASTVVAASSKPRPSVALWPLANASGDPQAAWLASAIGEMLRTELSAGERLRVIPRENVARTQRDLAIANTGDLARDDVTRAATSLGATLVVDGSYVAIEAGGKRRVRVDLHLKDVKSGETLASIGQSGTDDELFDLVARAAASLRDAVHAPPIEASAERMARASIPVGGEAARAYAEGITALHAFDYGAARAHLERAVALDPAPPLPHAALSEALMAVGYANRAAAEAKTALDRSADVSREDRLVIEARWREATYDWPGAVDRWRVLAGFFPDTIDYGLALAHAYMKAGEPKRAIEAIDELRKLPPPARDDPRLDLVAGDASGSLDYREQARYARTALERARALGSRSLAAEATWIECRSKTNIGTDLKQAAEDLLRLEATYREIGNRVGAIRAALRAGRSYASVGEWDRGVHEIVRALAEAHDLEYPGLEGRGEWIYAQTLRRRDEASALPHLAKGLAIARRVGDKMTEQAIMNETALVEWSLGHLADARADFEGAVKLAAADGSKNDEINALDNLGFVLFDLGEAREALAIHGRTAVRYRDEMGNLHDLAITRNQQALILLEMGDPVAALAKLEEGERETAGAADAETVAGTRSRRAEIVAERGDVDTARVLHRSSIEDNRRTGSSEAADHGERALAALDVSCGSSRTADLRRWTKERPTDATTRATLAASLLLDGATVEATNEARRSLALAAKSEVYVGRIAASILAAHVLARTGVSSEAAAIADPIARDTESRGLLRWALEARLVLAEATPGDGARARFDDVERDAQSHGLIALAQRAAAARRARFGQ